MTETPSWIGEPLRPKQMFALMFCGVTGLMIPGVQPLLLSGLADAGRVAPSALGGIATAEMLVMGLTAGVAGTALKAHRLRTWAIVALTALTLLDILTPFMRGNAIMLVRGLAGLPSGILVWLVIAMIARTPTPERWAGAYVTAQTAAQFVLATIVTRFVHPGWGGDAGFLGLALVCLANALFIAWLPSTLAALPDEAIAGLPSLRGGWALVVNVLSLGATGAAWVFVGQLSSQAHHSPEIAGDAVSLSLAFQIVGGLVATALAGRLHWFWALLACFAADIAIFATIASLPSAPVFLAISAVFGFTWLFGIPFLVPLTIEADPTRRAALLIGGAQLIGGSLAPAVASLLVTDTDARGALLFSTVSLMLGSAIVVALHLTRVVPSAEAAN
ncbi:MAG: MFS transporter [Terricaulis sp.]